MDKGIENHYIQGLTSAENIIKKWRKSELGATDAYMQLLIVRLSSLDITETLHKQAGLPLTESLGFRF